MLRYHPMRLRRIPILHRRTLLLYAGAIVVPSLALLWLGIQSFERQRQTLADLQRDRFAVEMENREREAARQALRHKGTAAIVRHRFLMENGAVTRPSLHAPPPGDTPLEFVPAEIEELVNHDPAAALRQYRTLHNSGPAGLALARAARCLAKLGRAGDARAVWRRLAAEYADARDLAHRPYGIVAAIEAGDVGGLYDRIAAGRWELSADQAEYFLAQLDPRRPSPYLDQFAFARDLSDHFRHAVRFEDDELFRFAFNQRAIYYHSLSPGRIDGIEVDPRWTDSVGAEVRADLGFDRVTSGAAVYTAAIALVIAILSAGVFVLLRDLSREARLNVLRSDFVGGVSHELKTPVAVIRLYAETLLRGAVADEEQRLEFYRTITRESGRLSLLIDRVLAFSRLDSGAEIYRLEPGDPVPVILRTLDDYREYLDQGGFRLNREVPMTAPPILFDETALSQAVVSLLENAVKYCGAEREVRVRLTAGEKDVVLEVEDRGIGIAPAEQARIFERYYRVQNGAGKGGYGLGLYLVRKIMEAHGGRAEVESEQGRGSRFRLVFPVAHL